MSKLMQFWKSTVCYQLKTIKWYQFTGFIWVAFCHPLYLFGGYYLAMFEYGIRHWNDAQGEFVSVNPVVFSLIMIIIAELRFKLFCKWHRPLQLSHQQLMARFIKVNWWNFPWVIVYFSLLGPMEGNVFAFFLIFTLPLSGSMSFLVLHLAKRSAQRAAV